MRRSVLALLLTGIGCASATRTTPGPVATEAPPVGAVTAEELRRGPYAFSDDSISGRLAQILPQRPAAIVILLTGKGTELFEQSAPQLERAVALRTNAPDVPEDERQIPMILLGVPVVGSPLLPTGWPTDDRAQVL